MAQLSLAQANKIVEAALAKEAADILGKVFGPDHVAPLVPGAMLPPPGREI